MTHELKAEHRPERSRFEVDLEGQSAVLEYEMSGETIHLRHTEVPMGLRGRGVASALAKTALEYAREHLLTVKPTCPFVRGYIRRHPEYRILTRPQPASGETGR